MAYVNLVMIEQIRPNMRCFLPNEHHVLQLMSYNLIFNTALISSIINQCFGQQINILKVVGYI